MAVVVTGSAGFVGQTTVRTLLDAGYAVVGVDRRPHPPPVGLNPVAGRRFTSLTADLLAGDAGVREALDSADAVVHLAGCPGVRDGGPDVAQRRHRDNVLATQVVLDAVPLRTPLVVASSSSVYGGSVAGKPCVESDVLRPMGGYAESKRAAEQLCRRRIDAGGVVAMARMFTVAGEGQRPDMALTRWIAAARNGQALHIFGSLDRTRDITDVRDAARALVALAERHVRGPMNVGTGVGHRLRSLVDVTAEVLGVDVTTAVTPAHPDEVSDTLADVRRLRKAVGFVPVTDLRDVITRQVAASGQTDAGTGVGTAAGSARHRGSGVVTVT
ncbi:NAD(P)-dependent oxidoreductase [Actinopolymorpha sp. B9G3]|uniref:NAD-dependent epimerase/dehydratase family protein n=1 Tax=Actinopolymorpha sp. B9G3 TaxID=3158970 RepID=UPI0032D93EC3